MRLQTRSTTRARSVSYQNFLRSCGLCAWSNGERWIRDELERAVFVFHQRGAAFDPITAVVISDVTELSDPGRMNVATQHRVDRKLLGVAYDRFLELADEIHRVFHALFRIGA